MTRLSVLFRFYVLLLLFIGISVDTIASTFPLPFGTSSQTTHNNTPRNFTIRNPLSTQNIVGNYAIIGNSNQCSVDHYDKSSAPWTGKCISSNNKKAYSNYYPSRYIDIDSNSTTKNSTSSKLNIPSGSKVVWAGLYWQGVVHNSLKSGDFMGTPGHDDGITISNEPTFYSGQSPNQIDFSNANGGTYDADKVLLKLPNGNYQEITADVLDYYKLGYAGFKDITSLINTQNPNGNYTVADIKSNQGMEKNHGNYAAWAIVVIYENPKESLKNISLFDGYETVNISFDQNLTMSGFRTPKRPPIKSKIAMFVMDGDNGSNALTVISEGGNTTKIANADHPNHSLFDATISSNIKRNPDTSSLRTDLKVIDLVDVLGPSESKATLIPRSGGDRYTPSFFIMSAELYSPEICYDYTVDLGTGHYITNDKHKINSLISQDKNMTTKVFIKATQADFDLLNNTLYLSNLDPKKWDFQGGENSPSNTSAYFQAHSVDRDPSHSGIAIGDNDGNMTNGGIIKENTNYYAKFHHHYKDNSMMVNEQIEIELHAHIDFGSGEIPLVYTTDKGNLPRCETSAVYNPVFGRFSVERNNNRGETIPKKYTLYTQISGRPFDIDVISYDNNSSNELPISHVGVEVELFDAGTFENNASSGFDTVCQDYDKYRIYNHQFVTFNNTSRAPLKASDLAVSVALRSAAFRVWYITDINNSIVFDDTCYDEKSYATNTARDSCFASKYGGVKQSLDPHGFCSAQCAGNGTGCYECLKTNFGHPVCSRDNFAIRPESYRIVISDNNESNATGSFEITRNNTTNPKSYAAGYRYRIEANATRWNSDDNARRYFRHFGNKNATKLTFSDNSSCADQNDTIQPNYLFDDGILVPNTIGNDNTGTYTYKITDKEWTLVDQKGSKLKPYRNIGDCIASDTSVGGKNQKSGCWLSSEDGGTHTPITLFFTPYSFDLGGLKITDVGSSTEWLYMNDLGKNQTMGFKIEGNVTAINKQGKVTTNFTAGCAAKDVEMWMAHTMSPDEANITDRNGTFVPFQQALNGAVSETTQSDLNLSGTLNKSEFSDADKGSTIVKLIYNFKKRYVSPVSPAKVYFEALHASSKASRSHANQLPDYTPDGNIGIDQNRTFYYARISPTPGIDGMRVEELFVDTALRVMSYCDSTIFGDCNLSGMDPQSVENQSGSTGWYLMKDHLSALGDGEIKTFTVESVVSSVGTKSDVTISDGGPLLFVNGVYTTEKLGCPLEKRPLKATFVSDPDEWLKHNPNNPDGLPRFDLYFIKTGLYWKGMGETGHVITTEPLNDNKGRLGW